jgi:hypothetical protein
MWWGAGPCTVVLVGALRHGGKICSGVTCAVTIYLPDFSRRYRVAAFASGCRRIKGLEQRANSADLGVTTAHMTVRTVTAVPAYPADPAMSIVTTADLAVKAEFPADLAAVDLTNLAVGPCSRVFNRYLGSCRLCKEISRLCKKFCRLCKEVSRLCKITKELCRLLQPCCILLPSCSPPAPQPSHSPSPNSPSERFAVVAARRGQLVGILPPTPTTTTITTRVSLLSPPSLQPSPSAAAGL